MLLWNLIQCLQNGPKVYQEGCQTSLIHFGMSRMNCYRSSTDITRSFVCPLHYIYIFFNQHFIDAFLFLLAKQCTCICSDSLSSQFSHTSTLWNNGWPQCWYFFLLSFLTPERTWWNGRLAVFLMTLSDLKVISVI